MPYISDKMKKLNCNFKTSVRPKSVTLYNASHNRLNQNSWGFISSTFTRNLKTILLLLFPVRTDSLEKTLILGKTEGKKRRMSWLDGITDSMDRV